MIYQTVISYLIIFTLCDLMSSANISNIKKRKTGIRTGEDDEAKIIENVNEDTSLNDNNNEYSLNNREEETGNISEKDVTGESTHEQEDDNQDGDMKGGLTEVADDSQKELDEDSDNQNKSDETEEPGKDVINNTDDDNDDGNRAEFRPYVVGDTFTPQELLPITQKLMIQVKNPGEGKGFVSSCKSPEQLADKLFEAFFLTFKRIVTLSDIDITGLDSLQALALNGEAVGNITERVSESGENIFLRGQIVKVDSYPKMTKYQLIMKSLKPNDNKLRKGKSRDTELAKKLRKKRRLVVNKRRSGQDDTKGKQSACHWRYECKSPNDLDTCQLYSQCAGNRTVSNGEYIAVPQKSDEHSKAIQQFRKMLGISVIDEEVEKILENRVIRIKPQSLNGGNRIERVESLSEYFNNLVMVQARGATEALSSTVAGDDTTEINKDNGTDEADDSNEKSNKKQQEAPQIRKSLKFPKSTTP